MMYKNSSPTKTQNKESVKGFPTVIYFLIFQKLCRPLSYSIFPHHHWYKYDESRVYLSGDTSLVECSYKVCDGLKSENCEENWSLTSKGLIW